MPSEANSIFPLELVVIFADTKKEDNKMERWVRVEDELPDRTFDWVLVFADGAMCTMAYSSKNGFYGFKN